MKKNLFLSFFILLGFASILLLDAAQEIIENPKDSKNPNQGRTIELKEVRRIRDKVGHFYFSYPCNINISANGYLFVQDRKQLLQFNSEGEFLRNLIKIGQGPGEVEKISNYQLTEDEIIVNGSPNKILHFDYKGQVINEMVIKSPIRLTNFLFLHNSQYYFLEKDWTKLADHNEEIVPIPAKLYSLNKDAQTTNFHHSFPLRYFVAQNSGERIFMELDLLLFTYLERYLFVSNTPEYLINVFDTHDKKVVLRFKRKYSRIKPEKRDPKKGPTLTLSGKTYTQPEKKFKNDILSLLVVDHNLWIITSATNKEEGLYIDVFNSQGSYLDNFILKFPNDFPAITYAQYHITIKGKSIWAVMKDKKELYYVGKYQIEDKS